MLKKTLESHLDCKEIQPVHSKGDQSWVFTGRTNAKAETPILWPSHAKSWVIGKDSDAGRDCRQEEKGTTEDEMAGWHHQLNGHEFGWTPGVGDGRRPGMLQFMGSQRVGHNWTTELNWTEDECQGQCVNLCDTLCTSSSLSTLKRNNANWSDLYTRNYCTRSLPY